MPWIPGSVPLASLTVRRSNRNHMLHVVVVVVVVVVAFKNARVVGLLATESCLLGSRVLPPITGAALPETDHSSIKCSCPKRHPPVGIVC